MDRVIERRDIGEGLMCEVVRMLSIGLIHGDLSEFNVLIDPAGPVIIDLPQVVNAAGNNGAYLSLQNDGNVVIYSSSGSVLWSTGTAGH